MLIVTPADSQVSASAPNALLRWVRSTDGQQVIEQGECAMALLPRDEELVLALPPRLLSWHRLNVPRVGQQRLRAALDGLIEDRVLSEVSELHHALEPGARPGQTLWVASTDKARLREWVKALESSGRAVARIAPVLWPLVQSDAPAAASDATRSFAMEEPTNLHWAHADGQQVWLASASPLGVSCLPLSDRGTALPLQALMPAGANHSMVAGEFDAWLTDPAVASVAERALGRPLDPYPPAAWLLRAGQTDWNLAQFDLSLSSQARRSQQLRRGWRAFRQSPTWRAARWGLAGLLAVQLIGLNAAAVQERASLQAKQDAIRQTLQQAFPEVTLVLDAPVQMQREVARLQQASGQLAATDLESLLGALDQAAGGEPLDATQLAYDRAEGLRLSGWRTTEDQVRALQQTLQAQGWRARFDGAELALQVPLP